MNSEVGTGEIVFDCYKYSKEPNHLFSNYRYAIFIIFYNICAWRMVGGEPSGRVAWQCEQKWTATGWFWCSGSSFPPQKEVKGWQLCHRKGWSNSELLTSGLKPYTLYSSAAAKLSKTLDVAGTSHPKETRQTQVPFVKEKQQVRLDFNQLPPTWGIFSIPLFETENTTQETL